MTKQIKLIISLILFGTAIYLFKSNHSYKEKFKVETTQFELPHHPEWETFPLNLEKQQQIHAILSQKFSFLGKGARLLSFVSEDGQYVLKFFKYRYHKTHWAVRFLPDTFPFRNYRQRKIKKASLETVLNGYKIAYDYAPEQTGLIYVHLNPSTDSFPPVSLIDKFGQTHVLSLDKCYFVIQKRVDELESLLHELLIHQQVDIAKNKLFEVFDLYADLYAKGLNDLGIGILKNNGFIQNQPIHFDVSKLILDKAIHQSEQKIKNLRVLLQKIDAWLLKNYPTNHREIMNDLERKFQTHFFFNW